MSTAAVRAEQMAPPGMTIEQWADMDEDEPGELVDGQLVEEEVPEVDHEDIVAWLIAMIGGWILIHGGRFFGSELKYAVATRRGRKPDVSVYLPGTPLPPGRAPVVHAPPDIMIEVISRRPRDVRRDRIDKLAEYAAFGVRYYWLIQPSARTVEIYELQPGGRYLRIVGTSGGALAVPGCPDLVLDLDAMWTRVAGLGPPAPPRSKVTKLRKTAKK